MKEKKHNTKTLIRATSFLLLIGFMMGFQFRAITQPAIVETNFNWQKCFEIPYFKGGLVSANNGYYLISGTDGSDTMVNNFHGGSDILLVHTDSLGNILWKKCYGGSEIDYGRTLISSMDGHIFLIGRTSSDDGDVQSRQWDGSLAWVVKIDHQGDIIWEKTFGVEKGTGFTIRSFLALPDGGIAVSSVIQGKSGDVSQYFGGIDVWTVRLAAQGEMLWEKTYGNKGQLDNLLSMAYTHDSTIICAGAASVGGGMVECSLPSYEVYNAWLYEIDLQGNILWQYCYGGENGDLPHSIIQSDHGYIAAASSDSWGGDIVNQHV